MQISFLFPFKGNKGSECNLILRHYKFQPGEIDKIQQIVKNGNYFNGSKQYKAYLKIMNNNKKLNFMCNDSEMYTSSESLRSINVYTPINWSERRGAGHEIE